MADWSGMTVVCMASGPSLTAEDAELVHRWCNSEDDVHRVIVTNTTFRLAPWADALYAMDSAWWRLYAPEVKQNFSGERLTSSEGHAPSAAHISIHPSGNSGAGAITLALRRGASRVILLGYDCKYSTDGRRHWHGDHPERLGNSGNVEIFAGHFDEVKSHFPDATIVNATRDTALECWPRISLEEALA